MTRTSGDDFFDPYNRKFPAVRCPLCSSLGPAGTGCARCFAPAEIIKAIVGRKQPPSYIGVLGPSGAGKTVYLGMLLDMLSRGIGGLKGNPRGAFSLGLQRNLMLALEQQRFPGKTPTEPDRWQWVHCEVVAGRRGPTHDLIVPDVAGEAVAGELAFPGSNITVRTLIEKCAALIALVDVHGVATAGQGQELFAMQLVSYLAATRPSRWGKKFAPPVSVVFTKTDLFEDPIDDAEAFARANAPKLFALCEANLLKFKFFAASIAGSTAKLSDRDGGEMLIPLRVEPRGIIEPFAWLLDNQR